MQEYFREISNGNVLDWNSAKWNVINMEEHDTDIITLCKHQSSEEILALPGPWSATNAQQVCLQIDGDLNVVKSQQDQAQVSEILNRTSLESCINAGIKCF